MFNSFIVGCLNEALIMWSSVKMTVFSLLPPGGSRSWQVGGRLGWQLFVARFVVWSQLEGQALYKGTRAPRPHVEPPMVKPLTITFMSRNGSR